MTHRISMPSPALLGLILTAAVLSLPQASAHAADSAEGTAIAEKTPLATRLQTVTIAPFAFPDITVRALVSELEKLLRQQATPVGYTLRWQVATETLTRPDRRLTVAMSGAPLGALVSSVSTACGLRVTVTGQELRITEPGVSFEPLQTQTFKVLPSFWEAVDKNIEASPAAHPSKKPEDDEDLEDNEDKAKALPEPALFGPEVRALARFSPGRAKAFLAAAGIEFPAGTGLTVADDHLALTVTTTAANLASLGELLQMTYSVPFSWHLHVGLVRVDDRKLFTAASDLGEYMYGDWKTQVAKKAVTILADFSTDILPLAPAEHAVSLDLPGGGKLTAKVRLHPRQIVAEYTGTLFDLRYDLTVTTDAGEDLTHATGDSALLLARQGELPMPFPHLLPPDNGPGKPLCLLLWTEFEQEVPPAPESEESRAVIAPASTEDQRLLRILSEVRIPKVEFEEANVTEVLRWLSAQSRELDPMKQGITLSLILSGDPPAPQPLTMSMVNIPLGEVLRYMCMGCGLRYDVGSAIIVTDKDRSANAQDMRLYFVPGTDGRNFAGLVGGSVQTCFTQLGVEFPDGSWTQALSFNFGTLLVARNTPRNLRKIDEIIATGDTLLWFDGQVQTRLQVLEITDPAMLDKVQAWRRGALSSSSRDYELLALRLSRGTGARILFDDLTLATPERAAVVEWRRIVGEQTLVTRFTTHAKPDADYDGMAQQVAWSATLTDALGQCRVVGHWESSWQAHNVDLGIFPAPALAATPDAAARTFLTVMPRMINGFGSDKRGGWADDTDELPAEAVGAPRTASGDMTAPAAVPEKTNTPATPRSTDEPTPAASPREAETRFFTYRGSVEAVLAAGYIFPELAALENLSYNPRLTRLSVHGKPQELEALALVEASGWEEPRQFRVTVGQRLDMTPAAELLVFAGRTAVVPLQATANGARQELAFQVTERTCAERYELTYRRQELGIGDAPVADLAVKDVAKITMPPDTVTQLATDLFVRVTPVSTFGRPLGKPFADAVQRHNEERVARLATLAATLKPLGAVTIPEFALQDATLETAVTRLAATSTGREQSGTPGTGPRVTFAKAPHESLVADKPQGTAPSVDLTAALAAQNAKFAQQKVSLTVKNATVAEILQLLRFHYNCRMTAGPDEIAVSAIPDLAVQRWSVAKGLYKDNKADAGAWLAARGVTFTAADRALYLPAYDLVLATGTDAFLAAVGQALARETAD